MVRTVEGYYHANANKPNRKHGCNWFRVLIAFGKTPSWSGPAHQCPNRHTPYTSAEALVSENVWGGWKPVRRALEQRESTASGGLPSSCQRDGDGDLIGDSRRVSGGPMCTTEAWGTETTDECYQKALQLNRDGGPRDGVSCGDAIAPGYVDHEAYVQFGGSQASYRSVPEGFVPFANPVNSRGWVFLEIDNRTETFLDYTVFVEGTAQRDQDYTLEINREYRTGQYPIQQSDTVMIKAPPGNRFRVRLPVSGGSTLYELFKITPLNDGDATEGPETVVFRLAEPTPKERVLHWDGQKGWQTQVVQQPADDFQPYVNPQAKARTLTITDGPSNVSNTARPTLTIADVVAQEGTFGQWRNSYINVTGLANQPAGYCFSGRLTRTPDRRRDFSLFGVSGKLVFCRDRQGNYRQNRYSPSRHPRKNAKIYAWKDLHDDTSESYTIGFVTEQVWTNVQGRQTNLSLAQGPVVDSGTFVINNDGPLPKDWLARFGHVVASETVEAVTDRVRAPRPPGQRSASLGTMPPADGALYGLEALIGGSSFSLTGEERSNGSRVSAWGRVSASSFEADLDTLSLDSDNTHTLFGVDVGTERWLLGVGLGFHQGDGGAEPVPSASPVTDRYDIDSRLTSVFPYGSVTRGKTTVWGTVGYGSDELTLQRTTGSETVALGTADTTWRMAAVGFRSTRWQSGPVGLSLVGDALWSAIDSDESTGYRASRAESHRQRLGIESAIRFDTGWFTPGLFVRTEGGDVGAESGLELALDFSWAPVAGLTLSGSGRQVMENDNAFRSVSLGASYQTGHHGRPSVSYQADGEIALGWTRRWRRGVTLGLRAVPENHTARLDLSLRF